MNSKEMIKEFQKFKPVEKMEVCIELIIMICKDTGVDQNNRIFMEELKEMLEKLRHEK